VRKMPPVNLSRLTAKRPIVFVIGTAEIGGAEKQLVRLAQELKSRDVNVEVVFIQAGGPLTSALDKSGIAWRVFAIRLQRKQLVSIREVFKFCRYLVTRRPVLVNAWLPTSAVIAFPLVRILLPGCLRVASVRGISRPGARIFGKVYRIALGSAHQILPNAKYLVDIAVDKYKIPSDRVEIIPNGVEIPEDRSNVSPQPPTAVVIANFHHYKGHHVLLKALAQGSSPIKVRFCGAGDSRKEIEDAINSLGLSAVVTIVNSPADIPSEMRRAQFAIHPSSTEGLSNAILEEMATGLPVIAFALDGNSPVVAEAVT